MMLLAARALRRPLVAASTPLAASASVSLARLLATSAPSHKDKDSPPRPPTAPAESTSPIIDPIPVSSPSPSSPPTPPTDSTPTPTPSADTTPPPQQEGITRSTSLAEQYLDLSDVAPPSSEAFGQSTNARAKGSGGAKSSIEKKRANLRRVLGLVGLGTVVAGAAFLARDWEDEFEKMRLVGRTEDLESVEEAEQGGWVAALARAKLRGADMLDYLNKPAWDPLLPPPLPEPHYKPYTLVIDLDDLLVHSVWDIDHGWRTAKRPGVDYFLAYMSLFYEIVLFTTQPAYTAAPIIEKIDPYGAYIPWKLYRESTRYKNKTLIKDLSYLGRPLERTIILDTDSSLFQLQPTNGILMTPWEGTKGDPVAKELVGLIPFLEAIAIKRVPDVRPVIKFYEGRHIPTAYAEAEAETKRKVVEEWERNKEKTSGVVAGWLSAALGSIVKPPNRDTPPDTDMEAKRKIYQRMYLEEQKYWKDNEEIIKKQMDEDRDRQMKEMKNSLVGMMGLKPPEQT
ncbi:hypothetical protein RQP46_007717 [Phenoliferia psychrophenolica]